MSPSLGEAGQVELDIKFLAVAPLCRNAHRLGDDLGDPGAPQKRAKPSAWVARMRAGMATSSSYPVTSSAGQRNGAAALGLT